MISQLCPLQPRCLHKQTAGRKAAQLRMHTWRVPAMQEGLMSVLSTSNNTIITLADTEGRVKAWASAGTLGFSHSRKKTVHAAEAVAAHMGERVRTGPAIHALHRAARLAQWVLQGSGSLCITVTPIKSSFASAGERCKLCLQ